MNAKTSLLTFYRKRLVPCHALKPTTIRLYYERLRLFEQFLNHHPFLSDLTPARFSAFEAWLAGRELTRETRTKARWILRKVWELAYEDGIVKHSPPLRLRPRRGEAQIVKPESEPVSSPGPEVDDTPPASWEWEPGEMIVGAGSWSGGIMSAKPNEKTLSELVEQYFVNTHLKGSSVEWYQRVANVLRDYFGFDPPLSALTEPNLNRFLAAKTTERSAYYVRSLRSGILAILGPIVDPRRVRRVKLTKLRPSTWSHPDVAALVKAANVLPEYKRTYYARIIAFAFHTGLSQSDLHELTRADVKDDGTVVFHRGKTDSDVVAWVPPGLLSGLPDVGRLFPRYWSGEQFRKDFRRIVKVAGLTGTFKKLRKTSGTQAELLTGKGHEHLANSRRVFESHYLDQTLVHREPVRLPELGPLLEI